jgi:dipeptidyl aminopeptidase/acylaminoacyl peptidase
MRSLSISLGLVTALTAVPAFAQTPDAAALFGARTAATNMALSPDGTKLVFESAGAGQTSVLNLVDLTEATPKPKPILSAPGDPERLGRCRFVGNTRLLCQMWAVVNGAGRPVVATRFFSMDENGKGLKVLQTSRGVGEALNTDLYGGSVIDWNPGRDGHVLMVRQYVAESAGESRMAQSRDGLGVDLVDVATLKVMPREAPDVLNAEFLSDGQGAVRIRGRYATRDPSLQDGRAYFYRKKGESQWLKLSDAGEGPGGFDPYAVDSDLDVAYGLKKVDGRLAAFRVSLDGSLKQELVFAHPTVDVAGFVRVGRRNRVIGVAYVTDRREVHYIDPAMAALARGLTKALPNAPLVRIVDTSEDEGKLVIWAGSDTDPGRYYLFDRATRDLQELVGAREGLGKLTLAAMQPVEYPAADGTKIPAYLTLPPGSAGKKLPAIVMPHGGPSSRDEWGFDWLVQFWANQGYAVLQPQFRGSAGYGDAWFRQNGFVGWKTAVGDVNDAGRWLVAQGIADPAKLGIVGWSYGGYAALQSGVVEPGLFRGIVAIAPVTDLQRLAEEARGWTDYLSVLRTVGNGPHIEEGSPARHAARIKVPVLLVHGGNDANVSAGHSKLMKSRLEQAGTPSEFLFYKGLDHYLEDSTARAEMLRRSKAHLDAAFAAAK